MDINVHINIQEEIDELVKRFSIFSFLKQWYIPRDSKHRWMTNSKHWGYKNKITYALQIIFIGKTGYGKSTTLNQITGKNAFETSDISACTKNLYEAVYRIDKSVPSFFKLIDLPGLGESANADKKYIKWYKEMISHAEVVVYVLRADQRDFSVDEIVFRELFDTQDVRSKVMLVLNFADKIEPINRKGELSAEQLENLKRKVREISKIFKCRISDIIWYSASKNINLDKVAKRMAEKIRG